MSQSHVVAVALLNKVWPVGEWNLTPWEDEGEHKWVLTHPALPPESAMVYTMRVAGYRDHCAFVCQNHAALNPIPLAWLGTDDQLQIYTETWRTHSTKGRLQHLNSFTQRTLGKAHVEENKRLFHRAWKDVEDGRRYALVDIVRRKQAKQLKREFGALIKETGLTCQSQTGKNYCYEGEHHIHFGKSVVLSASNTSPNDPAMCDMTLTVHVMEPNRTEYFLSVLRQVMAILKQHTTDEARLKWVWDDAAKEAGLSELLVEEAPRHPITIGLPMSVFHPNYRP